MTLYNNNNLLLNYSEHLIMVIMVIYKCLFTSRPKLEYILFRFADSEAPSIHNYCPIRGLIKSPLDVLIEL